MEVKFSEKAKKDLIYWERNGTKSELKKLQNLLISIAETPFFGIGKPEALKYELSGFWSRRINREHRIIYEVMDEYVIIHSLKGHY